MLNQVNNQQDPMLSEKLLDTLPYSIRTIRKLYSESLDGALTLQQIRVLTLISEGQGLTQIADTLQVSLAAVSKMVSSLSKKKIIISKEGLDRRTHILTLTPQGKNSLEKIKKMVRSKLDIGINDLTKDECAQLMKGLSILEVLMKKFKEV
jgi:DNA-binding MarR family transcriptional regulator